jgi:hypothetical protein
MMAQEKNRALSARVDAYLSARPEKMVMMEQKTTEDEAESIGPSSPSDTGSEGQEVGPVDVKNGIWGKSWMKGKRFSRGLFK